MAFTGISEIGELLPDAVVVVDEVGRLKWANASAERLLGLRAGNVVGGSALEFVHPEDTDFVLSSLVSIQGKDIGTPIEIRVRAVDGWKLVEVVGTNLLANPKIAGVVLSMRDLTERRRWEVARDEVSRFRALVHNAATIIMLVDAAGRVESVSAAITRLLGHDPELVEGRLLSELVTERDRDRLDRVLADASRAVGADPRRALVEVHLVRHASGEEVPFELNIVNLLDDPTVRGIVVSGHDVTELRRSLEQLAEAQAELLRRTRLAAIGELASVISHELRNPLGAAANFVFLARQRLAENPDPELDELLSMAERQTIRAAALSEDLTTYVREHDPELEELDLLAVVEEVLDATPPPPGIQLEVEIEPMSLEADTVQLTQMLTNLVTNAYQAMPEGGRLRITASTADPFVKISVRDTGKGIEPEAMLRLFDPFFTTKAEGTGLGLSIVNRLATAHNGSIKLENNPGGGAIATLVLPKHATEDGLGK